ncbi:hypothetical protein Barb4_01914 [Bacteroidales bacterium Barb4]|nr:hypothetical protein Barb4_01914 [Bacteroidales bacterium Barb4]
MGLKSGVLAGLLRVAHSANPAIPTFRYPTFPDVLRRAEICCPFRASA